MADMLVHIFEIQEQLNDHTFARNNLRTTGGELLTIAAVREALEAQQLGPNDLPNLWLRNYLRALQEEARELERDLLWKWWSKDVIAVQNIRVELVDLLHFLVSLAQCAGLSAEDFYRLYLKKNQVNFQRQEQNYSQATKDESDNRDIR